MTTLTTHTARAARMLLRAGGRSWTVTPGQTLRLGRHPSNDVVLRGARASRFHAEVRWDGDYPVLRDLGSLNGTLVDGARLHHQIALRDGLHLRLGGELFFVERPTAALPPPAVLTESPEDLELFGERQRELRGTTRGQHELHRLLLDLEADERTGALRVSFDGQVAVLTFCLGKVVGARMGGRRGLAAVARVFGASRVSYRFGADFEACETALCVSPQAYLRKGHWSTARNMDRGELRRRLAG